MVTRIKNKLSPAGLVIAILALVVALGGVAFAKGVIITKLNQISPSVRKQLKGKAGPQGPKGDAGAPGTNGKDGAPGANGKSIAVTAITCGGLGGAEIKQEGSSSGVEICNGEEGPAGPTETVLPPGKTEMGEWALSGYKTETVSVYGAISYPLRLEPAPVVQKVRPGETEVEGCEGSVTDPQADPGYACIYMGGKSPEAAFWPALDGSERGVLLEADPGGSVLNEPTSAYGSWAVTAAE